MTAAPSPPQSLRLKLSDTAGRCPWAAVLAISCFHPMNTVLTYSTNLAPVLLTRLQVGHRPSAFSLSGLPLDTFHSSYPYISSLRYSSYYRNSRSSCGVSIPEVLINAWRIHHVRHEKSRSSACHNKILRTRSRKPAFVLA